MVTRPQWGLSGVVTGAQIFVFARESASATIRRFVWRVPTVLSHWTMAVKFASAKPDSRMACRFWCSEAHRTLN